MSVYDVYETDLTYVCPNCNEKNYSFNHKLELRDTHTDIECADCETEFVYALPCSAESIRLMLVDMDKGDWAGFILDAFLELHSHYELDILAHMYEKSWKYLAVFVEHVWENLDKYDWESYVEKVGV